MILLPSAVGTMSSPPFTFVPGRAVVIDGVWQTAQPVWLNSASPAETSAVIVPRGGAFVARRKSAKATTSTPSSSGSGTGSSPEPYPTYRPLDVFSSGNRGVVIPISLRYASAENDTRLACCPLHTYRHILVLH